jgi:hypothetical protein
MMLFFTSLLQAVRKIQENKKLESKLDYSKV